MASAVANPPIPRPLAPQERAHLSPEKQKMGSLGPLPADALRKIQEFVPMLLEVRPGTSPLTHRRTLWIYPLPTATKSLFKSLSDSDDDFSRTACREYCRSTAPETRRSLQSLHTLEYLSQPVLDKAFADTRTAETHALAESCATILSQLEASKLIDVQHRVPKELSARVSYFMETFRAPHIAAFARALYPPVMDDERGLDQRIADKAVSTGILGQMCETIPQDQQIALVDVPFLPVLKRFSNLTILCGGRIEQQVNEGYARALATSRAALFEDIADSLPDEFQHDVPADPAERIKYFKEHPEALQEICKALRSRNTYSMEEGDWETLPPELGHFCKDRLILGARNGRGFVLGGGPPWNFPRLQRALEFPKTVSPKYLDIYENDTLQYLKVTTPIQIELSDCRELRYIYAPRSKVVITGATADTLHVEALSVVFRRCNALTQTHAKTKLLKATHCRNLNQITAKKTVWAATEECPQLTVVDAPYAKRNRHLATLSLCLVTLTTAVIMLPTLSLLWPPTWMVIALFCLTILTAILWGLLVLANYFPF